MLTLTLSPNVPKCAFVVPRHLGAPLDVSKIISKPMVCLAQTMHLSCAETNTISKRTEQASTWHTLPRSTNGCVQSDFRSHRLFRHKPCTYLAPRLKLLQTDRNELLLDPRHLRVQSGASKMIYEPMVRLPKPCTYLASRLTLSSNGPKRVSTWPTSHWSTIGCAQNNFRAMVCSA
jgi:hypothetical protein